jgi:hypothetical protein
MPGFLISQLILESFNALEIGYLVIEATPSRHLSLVISAASRPTRGETQDDILAQWWNSYWLSIFITINAFSSGLR